MKTHPLKDSSHLNIPLTGPEKKVLGFLGSLFLLGLLVLAYRSLEGSSDRPLRVQQDLKESVKQASGWVKEKK